MSTENVSLASSINFGTHASAATNVHRRDDSPGRVTPLVAPRRRELASSRVVEQPTVRSDGDDALPMNDFMRHLHREKRRAERSKSPLSLALYRTDQRDARGKCNTDELLEVLHAAMRETDILGHVRDDTLAVLCPDTNEEGMKGFTRKIDGRAQSLSYSAVAATYPDHLFDSLDSGTRDATELLALLAADSPATGRPRN